MAKTFTLADMLRLQFSTLEALDADTVRKLEPVLRRAQDDLARDLNRFSDHSFSATQKRHSLVRIDRALAQLYNQADSDIKRYAEEFNEFGVEIANREVGDFQKGIGLSAPNVPRSVVSLKNNEYLYNTMQTSLKTYSLGIRQSIDRGLTDAVIQNQSGYEVVGRLGRYVEVKKWRLRRIVRTELAKIFNDTKLLTYQKFNQENFGGTLMKRMFHPMDNRTAKDSKEWAKADPAIPLNQPFRLRLQSGKIQEGMAPPLRPNDRAVIMPFHKKWKE